MSFKLKEFINNNIDKLDWSALSKNPNAINILENYLKKIDDSMKKDILESFHQECIQKNFDEINFMCVTERDKNNIIIDINHKTIPILTKYERCRAIGTRVKQLNSGAKPLVELREEIMDNYVIANRELREKKLPFIIQRPIANGKSEYWNINDLEFLE